MMDLLSIKKCNVASKLNFVNKSLQELADKRDVKVINISFLLSMAIFMLLSRATGTGVISADLSFCGDRG